MNEPTTSEPKAHSKVDGASHGQASTSFDVQRLVVAVVITVAALVVLELVVRFAVTSPMTHHHDPRWGVVRTPNTTITHSKEGYTRQQTNAEGLFDEEIETHHGQRWLLTGDSYAEALQLPREESIAHLVEAELEGVSIINAAQAGRSPVHNLLLARDKLASWRAVGLILVVNDGDVRDVFAKRTAHLVADDGSFRIEIPARDQDGPIEWISRRSALFFHLAFRGKQLSDKQLKRLKRKFGPTKTPKPSAFDADQTTRAFSWLNARYCELSVPVIMVYIPRLDYASGEATPHLPERRRVFVDAARDTCVELTDMTDTYVAYYREHGQPVHGFHNSIMGEGHINAAGHKLAAAELRRAILARGIEPP